MLVLGVTNHHNLYMHLDKNENNDPQYCFPGGLDSRLLCGRPGFDPWVGKIPWRRAWQPTAVFLPGESTCTEEPGRLQSMGLQRVRHGWATSHSKGDPLCQSKAYPLLIGSFQLSIYFTAIVPLLSRDVHKMHRVKHSAWYIERDSIFLNEQIIERINKMGSHTFPAPSEVSYYAYFVFWHVSLSIMTLFPFLFP